MSQKLDSLSKIIIATGQINYMAASISTVNEQIKSLPDKERDFRDAIELNTIVLKDTVVKLGFIMEELACFINEQGTSCPIDDKISKVPFQIIIQGIDDVNLINE